jgi:hypothetical protein
LILWDIYVDISRGRGQGKRMNEEFNHEYRKLWK